MSSLLNNDNKNVNQISALQLLINDLDVLAQKDFPIKEVIAVLQSSSLTLVDLAPYTFYVPARYTRNRMHKTASYELILMCWQTGQESAVHGHEGQKCWMRVFGGDLTFDNYTDHGVNGASLLKKVSTVVGGDGFVDGPAYIHSVKNAGTANALSLHLYAHPFNQCNAYDQEANHVVRIPLSYYSIDGKVCE